MKAIDLIRILYRNRIVLLLTPILLALVVVYLTWNPTFTYTSETTLYTGIASGGGVKTDVSISYFETNTAFDNLINVIKSRETKQEVAIRLLAQHLLLGHYDPKYISEKSYNELMVMTPVYIRKLVVHSDQPQPTVFPDSTLLSPDSIASSDSVSSEPFSFSNLSDTSGTSLFPPTINKWDYEQTVHNLKDCMASSDTNFVYKLLNYNNAHYSIDAISSIDVTRMESSDLVRLRFETDDPGICQQTLALFMETCIRNYKIIKENHSDAVVKYFEYELNNVSEKLKVSENNLLNFNEKNNIINYDEQTKAVATVKENLDVEYNEMRIKLAGAEASIRRIEEKLKNQKKIIPKNTEIVQMRNQLSDINAKIVAAETLNSENKVSVRELVRMHLDADKLKDNIRESVNDLYNYGNTTEGLPLQKLLSDWIDNVILYEETKAGMNVQNERIKEFQKQYAVYAPAGANMKRIEREITVNENEYLEILRGLSQAKLKVQDAELSSSIRTVDPPYYPLTANPTKRKILVVVAAFFGFLLILTLLLAMEYFDNSLKNPERAIKRIKLANIGVFPKIFLKTRFLDFPFVTDRLLELVLQNIGFYKKVTSNFHKTHTILIFSTVQKEGKSVLAGNLVLKMKSHGSKVLYLNYSPDTIQGKAVAKQKTRKSRKNRPYPLFSKLLGYEDKRVNYKSPFLRNPKEYLEPGEYMEYNMDAAYYTAEKYRDLLAGTGQILTYEPDYVLIEVPPVLQYQYPVNLIASAGTVLLVCRANRIWTAADEGILKNIQKSSRTEPVFLLNGVETPILESVLGELPKRRNRFRQFVKNLISLQFFNKQEF